jgi:hypothetical protein
MTHRADSGSVYKRGNTWTIGYYVRGKRIRESVQGARRKLRQRIAEIHASSVLPKINFASAISFS